MNYSFLEIPKGWDNLLEQMCNELKELNEDFNFLQIKEKFGELVCYHDSKSEKVREIIQKYRYLSNFVCSECGKPATIQTTNYILPYCNECGKHYLEQGKVKTLHFNPEYKFISFKNGQHLQLINISKEWEKYNEMYNN